MNIENLIVVDGQILPIESSLRFYIKPGVSRSDIVRKLRIPHSLVTKILNAGFNTDHNLCTSNGTYHCKIDTFGHFGWKSFLYQEIDLVNGSEFLTLNESPKAKRFKEILIYRRIIGRSKRNV